MLNTADLNLAARHHDGRAGAANPGLNKRGKVAPDPRKVLLHQLLQAPQVLQSLQLRELLRSYLGPILMHFFKAYS